MSEVWIIGDKVEGAKDRAAKLRSQYKLPPKAFELVLIGWDGRPAYRSSWPISVATLAATIDAMPMRQAGER